MADRGGLTEYVNGSNAVGIACRLFSDDRSRQLVDVPSSIALMTVIPRFCYGSVEQSDYGRLPESATWIWRVATMVQAVRLSSELFGAISSRAALPPFVTTNLGPKAGGSNVI
jgi:hypothetical protein